MNLQVVTLVDKLDDRIAPMRDSCDKMGIDFMVLCDGDRWINNAFKFRYLSKYLKESSLAESDLVMVVDAFDVIIDAPKEEIIESFSKFGKDIVFSAEANYYFREPQLSLEYWKNYPRKENSVYHFLNSGTFIGKVGSLRQLLVGIADAYNVDYGNDEQLAAIRSDQYLYSRYYVDLLTGKISSDFTIQLDHDQKLFGCSGGRMCVRSWPRISDIQDYFFFKYERRMLKTFGLKKFQMKCRDLSYDKKRVLINSFTGTKPIILHLPGTYFQFDSAVEKMKSLDSISIKSILKPIAWMLSLIAYIRSIINFQYIKSTNKGRYELTEIFPVTIAENGEIKTANKSLGTFPSDNPFTINE